MYSYRLYKINDIDFSMTPKDTFEHQGQEITYAEYYATRYNRYIEDLD